MQSSRTRGSAAAGIAAAGENCPREVIRQPQLSRGDKNQKFRVLIRILPPAEHITRDGEISEARQAGDRAGLFRIGEPANHGRFVLFDANSLRQRTIRNDGNAVHAGARQGADFEFEQQSNFIVGMQRGGSFYFHTQIDVLRGRIGRLRYSNRRAVREIRGILNDRNNALSGGGILRHQSDVGQSASGQRRGDECGRPRGGVELNTRGKRALSLTEINSDRLGAFVGYSEVRDGSVGKIGDHDSGRSRRGWQGRTRRFTERAVQIAASQQDRNGSAALVHDGEIQHAVGVQVPRCNGHRSSSHGDWRTGGFDKSDIQVLIDRAEENGNIVRTLIDDGKVLLSGVIDRVGAVAKIPADHGDRRGLRNRGGIRQLERRTRKLHKGAVSLSAEERDGIVALIGDCKVQKSVAVEVCDDHGPGIISNSKWRAGRFRKKPIGFAVGVDASQ